MSPTPRLHQTVSTACEHGRMCVHDQPGHNLGAIQLRLASATPAGWTDAVVAAIDSDGWVTLEPYDAQPSPTGTGVRSGGRASGGSDGSGTGWDSDWTAATTAQVWHHADLGRVLQPGDPVALHARYAVLAVGARRINVAVA